MVATSRIPDHDPSYEALSSETVKSSGTGKVEEKDKGAVKEEAESVRPALSTGRLKEIGEAMKLLADKLWGAGTGDRLANIMSKLMFNLTNMTQTIQRVATVQADEIRLKSEMQAFYTKLIDDVPIYNTTTNLPPSVLAKGTEWAQNKDNANALLQEVGIANQKMANITESLKNLRDMQGNDAKKIQSAMSVSDDAQKEMLDYLQNLLQKLREGLQAIFR